jgi:hypothetical protein
MDLDHEVTEGVMLCCFCIVLLHFKSSYEPPSSAEVKNE